MSNLINTQYRTNPNFHRTQVTQLLPEFFHTEYPRLITFLEKYYEYTGEDGTGSFGDKIHDLFGVRNISNTELGTLDLLIGEISDGLETTSFYQNPRLMARLLAHFYRNKGTQLSVEQFFKAFFDQDVEVSYPKKDIFILNDKPGGSLIGPQSLKYIQDDKKYQIFSILLKTGLSLSDYEEIYKKMVHPAGFYLAAEVETQGIASLNLQAGVTTDPLEPPNYAIVVQGTVVAPNIIPLYSLLTMEETDVMDLRTQSQRDTGGGIVVSSLETLEKYDGVSLQELADDFGTIGEWVGVASSRLDDEGLDISSGYETLDDDTYI